MLHVAGGYARSNDSGQNERLDSCEGDPKEQRERWMRWSVRGRLAQ